MKIIRYIKSRDINWSLINGALGILTLFNIACPALSIVFTGSQSYEKCQDFLYPKMAWFWGIYIFLFWSEETKELIKQSFKRIHKFFLTESEKYRNFESDEKDN